MLLKEVYEALRESRDWNNTILIVNCKDAAFFVDFGSHCFQKDDEHGGLYDHYVVPNQEIPNPDGLNSTLSCCQFNFTRIGVRVPVVVRIKAKSRVCLTKFLFSGRLPLLWLIRLLFMNRASQESCGSTRA